MKKSFLTLLIIILFVGFLESFPKHYIVETIAGTTKATEKVGKHHGCVDTSGRKYKADEALDEQDFYETFSIFLSPVCVCNDRKSAATKECRWKIEAFGGTSSLEDIVIDNEVECKRECHKADDYTDTNDEDVDDAEWLNGCLKECSDFVRKGLITKEEIQN